MKICGLKLTHDGSLTLLEDNKLLFCIEIEKIQNNFRHHPFEDFNLIESILRYENIDPGNIDRFVVDGWGDSDLNNPYKARLSYNKVRTLELKTSHYGRNIHSENLLESMTFSIENPDFNYSSYMHVSGHVIGTYCTSPFAKKYEDSFVLVWDGGMFPQLLYVHNKKTIVEPIGNLFPLNGYCYVAFAQQFAPFKGTAEFDLSVAGKLMAYVALGKSDESIKKAFLKIYNNIEKDDAFQLNLINAITAWGLDNRIDPKDLLANFHYFLSDLLISELERKLRKHPQYQRNICFTGGCALNIKWNTAIRRSGLVSELWVPPFPNDSGSSIGAASCEMVNNFGFVPLEWDVYAGPKLTNSKLDDSWGKEKYDTCQVAKLLFSTNEPIVVLNSRSELGPRALGNRSIIASPTSPTMKHHLNAIKNREDYRPVAPICLEEDAASFFDPGTPDPYMLFDHQAKEKCLSLCPAVVHLDGTARLQTINESQNKILYDLLISFKKLTGIPILCNTSANFNGSGFFPNNLSVAKWGRVNFIWSEGFLYFKKSKKNVLFPDN